jgi:hypothetical protein
LATARIQVKDRESSMAKCDAWSEEKTVAIGTPVRSEIIHLLDERPIDVDTVKPEDAGDAAHDYWGRRSFGTY